MARDPDIEEARRFLSSTAPFSEMAAEDVDFIAGRLSAVRFDAGETLVGPGDGVARCAWILREGVVEVVAPEARGAAADESVLRHLTPGDVFPVASLLAGKSAANVYRAAGEASCWRLARADFDTLARRSPVFLGFCTRRLGALLDFSERALQASHAEHADRRREMHAQLGSVIRRSPVTCAVGDPLREVFARMEDESVGSVIVVDPDRSGGPVAGIFTRRDVIARVVLAGRSLDDPVGAVMTSPVRTLDAGASVSDAMLLMAEHAIRHLPVTRDGALAGIVTEHDLFVRQRRGLRSIGDAIRVAASVRDLRHAAGEIRAWSRSLVAQGAAAAFVTGLISRLNDQLTVRLIALVAGRRGIDTDRFCWLAMGSEGREEQTIATDQDNGLIIGASPGVPRDAWLAFAREVNDALDACGYPLCKGGIMASNPKWCVDLPAWKDLFDTWIERGDPSSLLHSSIFFDFRPLAGDAGLARDLRAHVNARARANERFLKQMSDNALSNAPPSAWAGAFLETLFQREPHEIDLKLKGAMPFVDGARVLALAHGIEQTGTVQRLEALARESAIPEAEARDWSDAFLFVQSLRLRVQHDPEAGDANPNSVDTRALSGLDRRILKEAFAQARHLQRRLALDYP